MKKTFWMLKVELITHPTDKIIDLFVETQNIVDQIPKINCFSENSDHRDKNHFTVL